MTSPTNVGPFFDGNQYRTIVNLDGSTQREQISHITCPLRDFEYIETLEGQTIIDGLGNITFLPQDQIDQMNETTRKTCIVLPQKLYAYYLRALRVGKTLEPPMPCTVTVAAPEAPQTQGIAPQTQEIARRIQQIYDSALTQRTQHQVQEFEPLHERLNTFNTMISEKQQLFLQFRKDLRTQRQNTELLKQNKNELTNSEKQFQQYSNTLIEIAENIGSLLAIYGTNDTYSKRLTNNFKDSLNALYSLKTNYDQIKSDYEIHFPSFLGRTTEYMKVPGRTWLENDNTRWKISDPIGFIGTYAISGAAIGGLHWLYTADSWSIVSGSTAMHLAIGAAAIAPGILGAYLTHYHIDPCIRRKFKEEKPDLFSIAGKGESLLPASRPSAAQVYEFSNAQKAAVLRQEAEELRTKNALISPQNLTVAKALLENTLKKYSSKTSLGLFSSAAQVIPEDRQHDLHFKLTLALSEYVKTTDIHKKLDPDTESSVVSHKFWEYDELFSEGQRLANYHELRYILGQLKEYTNAAKATEHQQLACQVTEQRLLNQGQQASSLQNPTKTSLQDYDTAERRKHFTNLSKHVINSSGTTIFNLQDQKDKEFLNCLLNSLAQLNKEHFIHHITGPNGLYKALGLSPNDTVKEAFGKAYDEFKQKQRQRR